MAIIRTDLVHAPTCPDPESEERTTVVLWKTVMGEMRRVVYGCSACGETAQIERFEAAPEEEEELE